PYHAADTALCWSLAAVFLGCGALLWLQGSLATIGGKLGVPNDPDASLVPLLRRGLEAGTVLAIVLLSLGELILTLRDQAFQAPGDGFVLAALTPTARWVIPLTMVALGLCGFALRDRLPSHAFAAGLVLEGALAGGYVLGCLGRGVAFDVVHGTRVLQLCAGLAGLWALLWLVSRR